MRKIALAAATAATFAFAGMAQAEDMDRKTGALIIAAVANNCHGLKIPEHVLMQAVIAYAEETGQTDLSIAAKMMDSLSNFEFRAMDRSGQIDFCRNASIALAAM